MPTSKVEMLDEIREMKQRYAPQIEELSVELLFRLAIDDTYDPLELVANYMLSMMISAVIAEKYGQSGIELGCQTLRNEIEKGMLHVSEN